ncbi:MAG: 16S rRNA (adenine(1518)-N(6)/adenine(1519)-N(6))-dimethyltransferase RsmA [Gammaproteobacteria bacterium]|nr:MAG: 16S rRNA (adenine(1518)-N(6)/adenine(1519)-N(6))-dimethyltransferase RsmA [Gammaproteobacteria bacterium]
MAPPWTWRGQGWPTLAALPLPLRWPATCWKSVRARKRFGQHFLTDEAVLQRMADVIRLGPNDQVVEIGPGTGALTAVLHEAPARYLAVEIDRDLAPELTRRFPGVEVVNADVLRVSLEELLGSQSWRVVGNLPYNISTPLLVRLFAHADRIRDMHFMLQREVALRLAAVPGTKAWGRLTVLAQYHCQVELLFEVAPESFSPPPKVWSAVARLVPRGSKLPLKDPDMLDLVLRHAFSGRRKRLGNALKSLSMPWNDIDVDEAARPDQLSVKDFVALANAVPAEPAP